MKDKKYQVLTYLSQQKSWVTAVEISVALSYSVRSVKSYIADLNSAYPDIIASSRNGFLLENFSLASQILNTSPSSIPQNSEGRISYIIKKLIMEGLSYNLDQMAEDLCISPLTLTNEISRLKSKLGEFDLVFKSKNNIGSIEGSEKNKKKLISHLIYEDTKDFCCNLESLQVYLPNLDLKIVKHIITDILLKHQLFIDDFALMNFILHVGITMERSREGASSKETLPENVDDIIAPFILEIMEKMAKEIKQYFNITLTSGDIYDLSLLLMSQVVPENLMDSKKTSLEDVITPEIHELIELIQNKVRNTYRFNLNSQDFILRFALHLRNMLVRLKHNIHLRNPQFLTIKNTCPFIYDVSVFIADIINQREGCILSEDEIAYIALHIGVLIEEQRALMNKVMVLIVCPQYYSIHLNLVKKIGMIFEDDIIIAGVISSSDEIINYKDYQFIISTIPIIPHPSVPLIQIPVQMGNKDIGAITSVIESIKKQQLKMKMENKLKFLFYEDLIFFNQDFPSEKEAITFMADALEQQGFVDADFKESIFERESISSSAYTNIAMPHPFEMCSKQTAIAVSVHPSGINWKNNKVNIIFMLAIQEDDRPIFRDIFDFVTEIISDNRYLHALVSTKSYQEFIDLLVSLV